MKNRIKYKKYSKIFEGTANELEKYYKEAYFETIDKWFGTIATLEIGEKIEDVIQMQVIKKKGENLYILFSMTQDALIMEKGIKPLRLINAKSGN